MKILLCNERFLFRFGVDRVLLNLAAGFIARGHQVTLMGNRCDLEVIRSGNYRFIETPQAPDYIESNSVTSAWLKANWNSLWPEDTCPDMAMIAGWPFYEAISFFKAKGLGVIYNDYGAVPLEGFDGYALSVQMRLRELRGQYVPYCDAVFPISEFIAASQSREYAGKVAEIRTIYLGGDHLDSSLWTADNLKSSASSVDMERLKALKARKAKLILNLGRLETGNYKNSEAVFEVAQVIKKQLPGFKLMLLGNPDAIEIPGALADDVIFLGHPDDATLNAVMGLADLGLSVSLWEGFNLPLVEMQYLSKPVLAFDIGAHPEVAASPYCLCRNTLEMAEKAVEILSGRQIVGEDEYRGLRAYFKWDRSVDQYLAFMDEALRKSGKNPSARKNSKPGLVIDITCTSRGGLNSGVPRTSRQLSRALQDIANVLFVVWDDSRQAYVFPTFEEYSRLGDYNGPLVSQAKYVSLSSANRLPLTQTQIDAEGVSWLIFTEITPESYGRQVRQLMREQFGLRAAAIFYDAIPILRPEFIRDQPFIDNHLHYVLGLSECDLVMPISAVAAEDLSIIWKKHNLPRELNKKIKAISLPGAFAKIERQTTMADAGSEPAIKMLCVSTIEPRKNQKKLLEAALKLKTRRPEIQWELDLVGTVAAGYDDLALNIQNTARRHSNIRYLGVVADKTLINLYQEAAFTVFPSIEEGFGLPIMESLWFAKPCLCSRERAMGEVAAPGACLAIDMEDAESIYNALEVLVSSAFLRNKLAREAIRRPIKNWLDYASDLLDALGGIRSDNHSQRAENNIKDLLYPDCKQDNWQMLDSERAGLLLLLHRFSPKCCIEVGTYYGGSLSLIRQYAQEVFSIDIDPEVPGRVGRFRNVSYLTGFSKNLLPGLLKNLDEQGRPVDFILIDGDHSREGVRNDLEIVLDYVPKKDLIVAMHDSFNPDCRQGMLDADWNRSPYVKWVDLDFIPGRMIETEGDSAAGQLWGGLAAAYFSPSIRNGDLVVGQTSYRTQAIMSALSRGELTTGLDVRSPERWGGRYAYPSGRDSFDDRILICCNVYPPNFVGGAEIIAHLQALELRRRGYKVQIFAGEMSGTHPRHTFIEDDYQGFTVHRLHINHEDFSFTGVTTGEDAKVDRFKEVLAEFRAGKVLFHNLNGLSIKFIEIARRMSKTVLATMHDHWGFCVRGTLLRPDNSFCRNFDDCAKCHGTVAVAEYRDQIKRALSQAKALIFPSAYLAAQYQKAGFDSSKLKVINNGLEISRFTGIKRSASDRVRFSFIGILAPHKGVRLLLDAWASMPNREESILNITGTGPLEDELQRYVKDKGLGECIRFLGRVDNDKISTVYAQTDVFVLPSIWMENQPVTINEAMAASLPVIASNLGGNPELVEDGINGFLFRAGDQDDLAEKMGRFILNRQLIAAMGEKSGIKARNYSIEQNIDKVEDIFAV